MLDITLTLRVVSESYSLLDLEKLIGTATRGYSKGDPYSNGNKIRQKTYWSLRSSLSPSEKFDMHAYEIINFIEKNEEYFFLIKNTSEVDIFCMLTSKNGQGGLTFPSGLAEKIAQYSLNVVFDVYSE